MSAVRNEVHSLWVGNRLGWIDRLCLSSWMEKGHTAVLWTYEPVEGVPPGVEVRDARYVAPAEMISVETKSGSPALFSDYFRFKLLSLDRVTWFDTDAFLVRPLPLDSEYLLAQEHPGRLASGVLRLPPDSPVISEFLELYLSSAPIPFWRSPLIKAWWRLRARVGRPRPREDFSWGTFGPRALTELVRKHRLLDHALPIPCYFPVDWANFADVLGTPEEITALFTKDTVSIHLWGRDLRRLAPDGPPAGSWLRGQMDRLGY